MKTTFKVEDNEFVMYLEGRLDTAASSQAEKDLRALYDCEGHDVVLDCTDLEYISSSGLRLFLNVLKNAHAKGSSVNDDIRSVLEMTGFNSLFQFR